MRGARGSAVVAGVLAAGVLVLTPAGGAHAADVGDAGRFDTWAGYQVGRYPIEALAGDFNEDGAPDAAWVRGDFADNSLTVTLNLGDGTMGEPRNFGASVEEGADGVVAYLDGDQHLDVAVVSAVGFHNDVIDLYLGDGTGNFAHSTATGGDGVRRVAVGDLDADGDQDLALTNYYSPAEAETVSVLLNNGDATSSPRSPTASTVARSASSPPTSTTTVTSTSWRPRRDSPVTRWCSTHWSMTVTGR